MRRSLLERLFSRLLRLFPAEFRGDFGRQMTADFRDQQVEAKRTGALGVPRLAARTVVDVVRRAPREHFDIFKRDAVHAVRLLRRRPVSTVTVVLSLAIGIGLNTALFSVVNGVLWRSLPFEKSDALVRVAEVPVASPDRTEYLTGANFAALRDQSRTLERLAAGSYLNQTFVEPGEPEQIPGARVTEGYFETLRVRPILGRTFTPDDYIGSSSIDLYRVAPVSASSVMVISRALWERRFLGRADVIGQKLRLGSGVTVEIVGVVGPEMSSLHPGASPGGASLAVEWWFPQAPRRDARQEHIMDVVGRLAPGADLKTAQAELDVVAAHLASAFPDANQGRGLRATPLLDTVVENARLQLTFLFGSVFSVLIVTCVNVVHLSLSNAAGRRVELATRTALGATRAHLVRQALTESALLAAMGGVFGVLLALWALPVLVAMAPEGIPRLHEIRLDGATLAFAAGICVAVALICGAAASSPLRMSQPFNALRGSRSNGAAGGHRVRRALTIAEIAIALILVVASLLMTRTMRSLAALDLGFDPGGVITATLPRPTLPNTNAEEHGRVHAVEAAMISEVRQLPGVIAAGVGGSPMGLMMGLEGVKIPGDDRVFPIVGLTPMSAGYFEALGARLKAGRFFTSDDGAGAPTVVILSESAARRFWPSGNAIGQSLVLPANGPCRVIGIVADMSEVSLVAKGGGIFVPHVQSSYVTGTRMLVRTDGDPIRLVPALKSIVRRVNPEWPFPAVVPLQQEIDRATAPRRFVLQLVGLFSVIGLSLAVVGIYGVLAESVAERIPEIGIRMALGAQRTDVMALILRQGIRMLAAGLAIGLIGAFALRQQMTTFVYGVPTTDPLSYLAACVALALAALFACAIPTHRATRLDPVIALRTE